MSASGLVFVTLALGLEDSLSLLFIGLSVLSFIAALGVARPSYGGEWGEAEQGS